MHPTHDSSIKPLTTMHFVDLLLEFNWILGTFRPCTNGMDHCHVISPQYRFWSYLCTTYGHYAWT
jgi:hypothetical protein